MSDEADITDERIEAEIQLALRMARMAQPEAVAVGYCLNCTEPLPHPHRWCDADCQRDWKRLKEQEL